MPSQLRFLKLAVLTLMSSASFALPTGFIHLKYIDPTIIQDIRYATANNFVGKPIDGYEHRECILTRIPFLPSSKCRKN